MILGRVDEVDGHFIATRFIAGAIPTECLYIARTNPRATLAGKGDTGLRIRTDWRSIGLAYARVWFPLLSVVIPLSQALLGAVGASGIIASALLIAFSVAAHRAGRLAESEKARLRLLGSVTGYRIDPSKLKPSTRDIKRDALAELMEKGGIPVTADGIVSVLDDIPAPALPLVYGYARYAGDDAAWRNCATLVHERHERAEYS